MDEKTRKRLESLFSTEADKLARRMNEARQMGSREALDRALDDARVLQDTIERELGD